jgi:hypothetical protein
MKIKSALRWRFLAWMALNLFFLSLIVRAIHLNMSWSFIGAIGLMIMIGGHLFFNRRQDSDEKEK